MRKKRWNYVMLALYRNGMGAKNSRKAIKYIKKYNVEF